MPDPCAPATVTDPPLRIDTTRCTWRSLGEQVVVLDLAGSAYFELNHTAALLWPALVAGSDHPGLVHTLTVAGAPDAAGDVDAFLDELRRAGLLREDRTAT